jgi:hypothetical protein
VVPAGSEEVVYAATPLAFKGTVASRLPDAYMAILPVGVPVPAGLPDPRVTVDVRVSGWPYLPGFAENVIAVEVENPLTTTSTGEETLG